MGIVWDRVEKTVLLCLTRLVFDFMSRVSRLVKKLLAGGDRFSTKNI